MTVRPILIHPDPRLKKSCEAITDVDGKLASLADDMVATMYDAPGIGLAAPQIGVIQRLIVMDCTGKEEARAPMVLFNPEVLASSDELNTHEEGCLSIPEQFADVTRPAEVSVKFVDREGNEVQQDFAGLWATCVQHEIDHLNGKLFIDYLSSIKRSMITKRMKKLKKERARDS